MGAYIIFFDLLVETWVPGNGWVVRKGRHNLLLLQNEVKCAWSCGKKSVGPAFCAIDSLLSEKRREPDLRGLALF